MKKLLSLLATVSLVSTATASVVACGNEKNDPIDEDGNEDDNANQEQNISTIISVTDLGEIDFYSLTGSDSETQNVISEKIKNLNPNVGNAQINISNINPKNGTAVIGVQEYTGTVMVSFKTKISINLLITDTDLGDIDFYSLTGSDLQTETEIINQIRTLNPNVDNEQINISNINLVKGTATISVVGFNGSLTVTFTPLTPVTISFSSVPRSIVKLQDGTILVAGGTATDGSSSFLASVGVSDSTNIVQGSTAFPSIPRSMIELQDGTILVAGGTSAASSFLASVNLSNSQIQILAQGSTAFPSTLESIIQLQDGTILVVGGNNGADSFLASVNLSNSQIQILAQGADAFPAAPQSITQLQDGTILVIGGGSMMTSFLASIDLSDPADPQIQMLLAQGSSAFPSALGSIIQLQDGTILVVGGTIVSNSFLASIDLSDPANPQVQILAQNSNTFPSVPRSMIELQDGTILVIGGNNAANSFLKVI